jgi:hypothetical protein
MVRSLSFWKNSNIFKNKLNVTRVSRLIIRQFTSIGIHIIIIIIIQLNSVLNTGVVKMLTG